MSTPATRPVNAIEAVHPDLSQEQYMPYAPAVRVRAPADLLFISGSTDSPLYHQHPHVAEEHIHPVDIETQTQRALANIQIILDHEGLGWNHVVKVTKFLTDMRDLDGVNREMGKLFGGWKPASTAICVNCLSSPGARVELEMVAIRPLA